MFARREPVIEKKPSPAIIGRDLEETLTHLFRNAQSKVRIFSADLDNRQFGQPETVTEANLFLCMKGTSMEVIMSAEQHRKYLYHPLLDLRKKHPSKVGIRLMDDYKTVACRYEFMTIDDQSYFFRSDSKTIGITHPDDPETVAKLNGFFDTIWPSSVAPA